MTVEEKALIAERDELVDEIEQYLSAQQGVAFYPIELVKHFEQEHGSKEAIIISAIWRLIHDHRVMFDNQLKVAAK